MGGTFCQQSRDSKKQLYERPPGKFQTFFETGEVSAEGSVTTNGQATGYGVIKTAQSSPPSALSTEKRSYANVL
jgi:hypothetical protein